MNPHALVEKWRRDAAEYPVATDERAHAAAVAVRLCADELSAALRAPAVTGEADKALAALNVLEGMARCFVRQNDGFDTTKKFADDVRAALAAPPAAGAPPAPGWPDGNNAVRWKTNHDVQPVLSAVPNHAEGAQETQGLPRGDADGSHSPVVGAPPALVALVQAGDGLCQSARNISERLRGIGERTQAALWASHADIWENAKRALESPAPAPVAPPLPPDYVVQRGFFAGSLPDTADRIQFTIGGTGEAGSAVAGGDAPEIQVGDLVRIGLSIVWGHRRDWRVVEHDGRKLRVRRIWSTGHGEWTSVSNIEEVERNGVVIWRRRQEGQ